MHVRFGRRASETGGSNAARRRCSTLPKLKGPNKGQFFNLYVILDIFSRAIVGWLLAEHENAALAARLIAETCKRHHIRPGTLTIHADRGSPMTATSTALLLASLGVGKSHSRPHQSNDNPFSESQFKTMKYHPTFPERFGGIQDARAFCQRFFRWYNHEHRHGGIGLMTPWMVHSGRVETVRDARQAVLDHALGQNPQRFVRKPPRPPAPPNAVWINPPAQKIAA